MDTRKVAQEYRAARWAEIIQRRKESKLNVKKFCEREGIHENSYFYWQKKLREMAYVELTKTQNETNGTKQPVVFNEIKVIEQIAIPDAEPVQNIGNEKIQPHNNDDQAVNQIIIETSGIRITAGGEYAVEKLSILLRGLVKS